MISIIIPVYNEEHLIEPMVNQFKNLHEPHEVIVSDTDSSDGTVIAARKHADSVVLFDPAKRRGVSTGRNDGAAAAQGDFFAFMDCGSFLQDPNDFFRKALRHFREDPKLVALSGRIEVEKLVCTRNDAMVSFLMNIYFWFMDRFFKGGLASGKFIMVKRKEFIASGGFNENLTTAEDMDIFGRLGKFGHARVFWDLVIHHPGRRFHAKGAWRTLGLWMWNGICFLLFKKPSDKWEPVR